MLSKGVLGDTSLLPTNMNCGKIDTASVKCEHSCIIYPNVQIFSPNKGQISSVGDMAASSSISLCCTLIMEGF